MAIMPSQCDSVSSRFLSAVMLVVEEPCVCIMDATFSVVFCSMVTSAWTAEAARNPPVTRHAIRSACKRCLFKLSHSSNGSRYINPCGRISRGDLHRTTFDGFERYLPRSGESIPAVSRPIRPGRDAVGYGFGPWG